MPEKTIEKEKLSAQKKTPVKRATKDYYVIAIGASAGGLEAIKSFFDNVPSDCPHSFVIIQHLSPDYKSMMAELLKKNTELPIHEVQNDMYLKSGAIYLIPPKMNMTTHAGKLTLKSKPPGHDLNLPIDVFLNSLANEYKEKAIGIILSGTGSDGSRGIKSIKESGGMVMVQSPEQAKFDGMPLSAINTGLVDYVLPVEQLPVELLLYIDQPKIDGLNEKILIKDKNSLDKILHHIRQFTELDFEYYKRPTLIRRISRRMVVNGCNTLAEYLEYLYNHSEEITVLHNEFLIGVTKFFRDSSAWERLEKDIFPKLIEDKKDGDILKIWCIATSSGEEAYSIAIAVQEEIIKQKKSLEVKIFATDIGRTNLDFASKGVYPKSIAADISKKRLKENFIKKGEQYQVTTSLRHTVIFSYHNILNDPPFSKMDMVVCRNMLIYMGPEAQEKVMGKIHFALSLNGILFLGNSESVGNRNNVLKELDQKNKIYLNVSKSNRAFVESEDFRVIKPGPSNIKPVNKQSIETRLLGIMSEELIDEIGLAGVFIDMNFEIIHAAGEFRKYVELPERGFSTNIRKMVPEKLSASISRAVRKSTKENQKVLLRDVKLEREDMVHVIDILVKPFDLDNTGVYTHYLVLFIQKELKESSANIIETSNSSSIATIDEEHEKEIEDLREKLQDSIEKAETNYEELQATNEELLAANEELQSTNEELQSVNEELHTVNAEFQSKINDVTNLNDDLDNLLVSTQIATIFLDSDLRIRKFTPAIQDHFNLREDDIGRPISHFRINFDNTADANIIADAEKVIKTGIATQEEIQNQNTRWYLKNIQPYIDSKKEISGVVISLIDISENKAAFSELEKNRDELERINKELEQFAYVSSHDLQEPLNTIHGFIDILLEREIANLSKDGVKHLHIIKQSGSRMLELIHGLLEYSRLGKSKLKTKIDLNILVNQVLNDLDAKINETKSEIIIEQLPSIEVYETEMRQLFQNLITNSIKFRKNEIKTVVKIGVMKKDNLWQFSVIDNGIGIDEKYKEKVFEIFQRLHSDQEYKGSGIGLAQCKKIANLHEGDIWLESTLGQGTTFYFTIRG